MARPGGRPDWATVGSSLLQPVKCQLLFLSGSHIAYFILTPEKDAGQIRQAQHLKESELIRSQVNASLLCVDKIAEVEGQVAP